MDFNDDLDFEPMDDLTESVVDSDVIPIEAEETIDEDTMPIDLNNQSDVTPLEIENEETISIIPDVTKSSVSSEEVENTKANIQDDIIPVTATNIVEEIKPSITQEENVEPIKLTEDDSTNFSDEFNKLTEKEEILNMNPELKEKPKHVSFFQKYAVALPIFAFVLTLFLGLYIFASNTHADETNLIRIEEKNKIGYINDLGEKIVNTKYISGTEFYKGYAVVKNQNNLTGIINNKGNMVSHFGNYFYIERFSNNYIVSKFTNQGLKLGLLNTGLNEITKFKYDNISYAKNGTFLFTRDDVMGILNEHGKEIYTFAVDETDNKDISIEVSNVDTNNLSEIYAKIKVNNSSTIINLGTGNEVYSYTLDDLYVLDNNVFYIRTKTDNNKYIVVRNNKVAYETTNYKLVRLEDYKSNILVCLKSNMKYDYINLNTRKIINDNENYNYYYGSGLILENKNDFDEDKVTYQIKNTTRTLGEFKGYKPVDNEIVNNMIKVYTKNDKYNFVNTSGKIISEKEYDFADNFNKFGYAIVSKNDLYGVIDNTGKEVVPLKYENITEINEDLFENMHKKYNKDLFMFSSGNKVGIIDVNSGIIIKASYDTFKFVTTKYPIILGVIDEDENVINIDQVNEFNLKVKNDIEVHENYIFVDDKYYNYNAKLIYKLGGLE